MTNAPRPGITTFGSEMSGPMDLDDFVAYLDATVLYSGANVDVDARIIEDLELDSLTRTEVLFAVEELGHDVDRTEFDDCVTLRDVHVLYVRAAGQAR